MDTSRRRPWGFVGRWCTGAAVVTFVLAGCGGDGGVAPSGVVEAEDGTLMVIGEDTVFGAGAYAAESGDVEIVYENEGRIIHTLVIEGVDDFKLTVRSRGDRDVGTVELEPGEYEMYCDVPGHRRQGMEAPLTVS